jgi:hypothetical protein
LLEDEIHASIPMHSFYSDQLQSLSVIPYFFT